MSEGFEKLVSDIKKTNMALLSQNDLLARCRDWIRDHEHLAEDKGLIVIPLLRAIDAALPTIQDKHETQIPTA